jgi:riboflavin kinase/FMN adenylyltransferase
VQVITNLKDFSLKNHTGVALGNFDGLHIGHMALIRTMISECRLNGISSVVYTFMKHPENILRKNLYNPLITNNDQKSALLENMDIDYLCYQEFDEEFSRLSPEDFVRNILIGKLNVRIAVVGFNYRFGYMGRGDTELLKYLGQEYGFKVIVVPPVRVNAEIVSSTLIRENIRKGRMDKVFQLLGRHFSLNGTVVGGRRIGRTLGFPTANIIADPEMVLPANGVYITKTRINGQWMNSVTNIGNAPTVRGQGGSFSIETHILNYADDLYGTQIEVCFFEKLRGEKRYESTEALKKQVLEDINRAAAYWHVLTN